jgi:hypothetical protein
MLRKRSTTKIYSPSSSVNVPVGHVCQRSNNRSPSHGGEISQPPLASRSSKLPPYCLISHANFCTIRRQNNTCCSQQWFYPPI